MFVGFSKRCRALHLAGLIAALACVAKLVLFDVQGLDLVISDMELGSDVRVFNMIGQNIVKGKADFAEKKIQLPSKGMYIVRVGSKSSVINVK